MSRSAELVLESDSAAARNRRPNLRFANFKQCTDVLYNFTQRFTSPMSEYLRVVCFNGLNVSGLLSSVRASVSAPVAVAFVFSQHCVMLSLSFDRSSVFDKCYHSENLNYFLYIKESKSLYHTWLIIERMY